ncbi:MAG: hypothetical protein HWQ44_10080 [Nostoc sp. JL34]|nr:hypothetical protein [Nostoc sp. JL34]
MSNLTKSHCFHCSYDRGLLGLAYIWVGDTNGVQIQILATWIFYAVLNQLCLDLAIALNQP